MIVKCDLDECIYNENNKCKKEEIELVRWGADQICMDEKLKKYKQNK